MATQGRATPEAHGGTIAPNETALVNPAPSRSGKKPHPIGERIENILDAQLVTRDAERAVAEANAAIEALDAARCAQVAREALVVADRAMAAGRAAMRQACMILENDLRRQRRSAA
jgi:hypothetical protein